ncbi:MAG: N-acetylmuramoyl-L-alanine amidase [Myxococcales bacterium]|nr:N-acetylmuramoyl-L-alanine amidase [Myxococcales bacterium]
MTTDSFGLPRIIIAGEDVPVPGALKIVTFKDPGGFSFYSTTTNIPISSQLWYDRVRKGKVIRTREELKEVVHMVVLHTDCTRNSKQCYMVLVNRGLSTHFMIDWDGTIYQATDLIHCAAHAGGVNMQSVGIDLNNLLLPFHPGDPDKPYRTAVGAGHDEQFQDPAFRRPEANEFEFMKLQNSVIRSYGYTDQQYQALTALLRALSAELPLLSPSTEGDENPIPRHPMDEKGKVITTALQDGDALGWRGVLGHWHITPGKWDPGPGFDWDRMYHSLRGEDNFFPVELDANRKRGSVVTEKDMVDVANRYFENNERGSGGYYGVGVNQAWHGGMHIRTPVGTPVNAMFTGHVVAARLGSQTALGSNNFVLVRHVLPMPTTNDPTRKMTLYSLYMHLNEQDLSDAALADSTRKDVPKWLHDLYRISRMLDDADAAKDKGAASSDNQKKEAKDKKKKDLDKVPEQKDIAPSEEENAAQDIKEIVDRSERKPYLEFGPGLSALRTGKVAYFPWKSDSETENLKVPSGSLLGYSGEFGPARTREALIHVELFSDKSWREAIDLALHSDSFSVMEEDTPGTLHVESPSVLRIFGAKRKISIGTKKFLFDETRLRPDDIQRFFEDPARDVERGYLRKSIIRHVSEWSDQVDWIKALSDAQDWAAKCQDFEALLQDQSQRYRKGVFSSAILEILPFIWLTADTAKHIGLDVTEWDGTLYHFHPIHFLMWLTFRSSNRVRVFAKSKTRKQLEKEQKKTIEKAQEQRFSLGPAGAEGEELLDESLFVDVGARVPNPKELLDPFRGLRRRGLWRWTFGAGDEQGG